MITFHYAASATRDERRSMPSETWAALVDRDGFPPPVNLTARYHTRVLRCDGDNCGAAPVIGVRGPEGADYTFCRGCYEKWKVKMRAHERASPPVDGAPEVEAP